MALLLVHAICVFRKNFRTMALNTVGDFLRRRPFRRLPLSVKVFVEVVHHGIDDLPRYLGAALIFLFGSDLGAGGQRPLRNRCVAERSHRLDLDLLGDRRDIIEPLRREMHSRVPPHHPVYHCRIAEILVINNEVDKVRTDAQCAAKRAMSGVTLPCMLKHVIRQGCPGITGFLFQKAGVPQPRAIPSAFVLEVGAIGPPAGLKRIKLDPFPWERRGCSGRWCWSRTGITHATHDPSREEHGRPCQDSPAETNLVFSFCPFIMSSSHRIRPFASFIRIQRTALL